MLERILVPLDGSPLADGILAPMSETLSRSSDVTLLGVVPSNVLQEDHAPGKNPLTLARQHLARRRDELLERGIRARSQIAIGDPAGKIIDLAREDGTTLIVMSTHGRTGAARLLRGSIAERVLRHSPVPVLVANPKALAQPSHRFERVLVPLDGSEMSAEIVPLVIELAKLHRSEVLIFYSMPVAVAMEPWVVTAPSMSTEDAERLLERFQARFHDVPVRRLVAYGDPASSILGLIEREKIDLVAMTTHGRTGASRWLLGSVAEQVLRHATCPLLVKRTAGPKLEARARREADAVSLGK